MGIPSYFVHIVKSHSSIIKKFCPKSINIHNLYLDSNSIIYDALKEIVFTNKDNYENSVIDWVCRKILYYIDLIQPLKKVFIAFDGVAPVAKLEQQRNRRYKSWYTKNYISDSIQKKNKDEWNPAAITPGTDFMENLYKKIISFFNIKKTYLEINISGTNDCGEGEHKIYKYIRNNKEYHKETNTINIWFRRGFNNVNTNTHKNIRKSLFI